MIGYLILLLALAGLALFIQSSRLHATEDHAKHYKDMEAHYEGLWRGAENSLTRQLQLNKYLNNWLAMLNKQRRMNAVKVLDEHPRLTPKKLRRILNAHYKRQSIKPKRRSERASAASLITSCMEVMEGGFTSKEQVANAKVAVRGALRYVRIYNTRPRISRTTPFNSYTP